jgi:hypothetical protein
MLRRWSTAAGRWPVLMTNRRACGGVVQLGVLGRLAEAQRESGGGDAHLLGVEVPCVAEIAQFQGLAEQGTHLAFATAGDRR